VHASGGARSGLADVGRLWEYACKLFQVRRFPWSQACSLGTVNPSVSFEASNPAERRCLHHGRGAGHRSDRQPHVGASVHNGTAQYPAPRSRAPPPTARSRSPRPARPSAGLQPGRCRLHDALEINPHLAADAVLAHPRWIVQQDRRRITRTATRFPSGCRRPQPVQAQRTVSGRWDLGGKPCVGRGRRTGSQPCVDNRHHRPPMSLRP